MDQTSPFEMITLALEYILFAAFFVILVQTINLRDRFAETRTEQVNKIREIKQYREFNHYDRGECIGEGCVNHLYGDEVIELIRKYYDDVDFEIYIDKTSNVGEELIVNTTVVATNQEAYSLESLQKIISSKSEFHPYLIYDGVTPSIFTIYQNSSLGTVTGIVLFWKKDN